MQFVEYNRLLLILHFIRSRRIISLVSDETNILQNNSMPSLQYVFVQI